MTRTRTLPQLDEEVLGLLVSFERHGTHYDLVLAPVGRNMDEALKPPWVVRMVAFPAYDTDELPALEWCHHTLDVMQAFLNGHLDICYPR